MVTPFAEQKNNSAPDQFSLCGAKDRCADLLAYTSLDEKIENQTRYQALPNALKCNTA